MQNKVDTQGFIINGLRAAIKQINTDVNCRELYFVYYDLIDHTVYVDVPAGYSTSRILIIESGVYKMTQQELADVIIDKLKDIVYNSVKE